jgi:hypothetical protein
MKVSLALAIAGGVAMAVLASAAATSGGASVTGGGQADFPCEKTVYSISAHVVNGTVRGIVTETGNCFGGSGASHTTAAIDCLQVSGSLAMLTARTIAASGAFAGSIGAENTFTINDGGHGGVDEIGVDESGEPCDFGAELAGVLYHGNITVRATP